MRFFVDLPIVVRPVDSSHRVPLGFYRRSCRGLHAAHRTQTGNTTLTIDTSLFFCPPLLDLPELARWQHALRQSQMGDLRHPHPALWNEDSLGSGSLTFYLLDYYVI